MTLSGTPQGDDAAPEQEGIWEDPPEADGPSDGAVGDVRRSSAPSDSGGLTHNITSTARTPGPAGLYFADVPNRIMGLVIDFIVLSITGFALAWLFGGLVSEPGALDSAGGELDIAAFLVVLVLQLLISFAYFGSLWVTVGATLGMRLLGMRIGDEADGRLLDRRAAIVRWLLLGIPAVLTSLVVYVPNTIGVILAALGLVWLLLLLYTMAQSPNKQGLHDRYAHSILVRTRRRSA